MGDVAPERGARGFPEQRTHGSPFADQEDSAGPCPVPVVLLWGPWAVALWEWLLPQMSPRSPRCCRSSFTPTPPALNPRLGHNQTKVAEGPPNPSLFSALCCNRMPGRWGPKSPSSWLSGLGGLPGGGIQRQEKAGSGRQGTGSCREQGDVGAQPALPLKAGLRLAGLSFPTYPVKAFPTLEPVFLLNEEACRQRDLIPGNQGPQTGRSLDKARSVPQLTNVPFLPLAGSSVSFSTRLINREVPTSILYVTFEIMMGLSFRDTGV